MANPVRPTPFTPGFRLVDGSDLNDAFSQEVAGAQDAITASTTQTRAGGAAITVPVNRVSSANASDAVTLCGVKGTTPSVEVRAGMKFWVKNTSGQTIQVFPPGASDTIDGGSAGAAVNLATASIGFYMCTAVTAAGVATWASGKMAVSS